MLWLLCHTPRSSTVSQLSPVVTAFPLACTWAVLRVLDDVKKNELKLVICKSQRRPQIFLWGKKKRTNQEWRGSEYRQPVDCIQSWQDVKWRMSEGEGLHNHNPTNPLWPATGETNYKFQLNTSKMHYFWNVFIIIKSKLFISKLFPFFHSND